MRQYRQAASVINALSLDIRNYLHVHSQSVFSTLPFGRPFLAPPTLSCVPPSQSAAGRITSIFSSDPFPAPSTLSPLSLTTHLLPVVYTYRHDPVLHSLRPSSPACFASQNVPATCCVF